MSATLYRGEIRLVERSQHVCDAAGLEVRTEHEELHEIRARTISQRPRRRGRRNIEIDPHVTGFDDRELRCPDEPHPRVDRTPCEDRVGVADNLRGDGLDL